MKPLCWLRLLVGILAGALAESLRAQVVDDAVTVPVHFQGKFNAQNTGDPEDPAFVYITPLGTGGFQASGTSMGGTGIYTSGAFARLRPGRSYWFQVSTYYLTRVQVKITPPSGHRVFIDGVENEMFDWQAGGGLLGSDKYFVVRLEDGNGAAVGEASSVRPGRVLWSVGLGTLKNGKPAGSLRIAEDGVTANTFRPAALYYDQDNIGNSNYMSDNGEVIVVRSGGILRQVYATTVFADIITLNDWSYQIRLYSRDQVGGQLSSGLFTVSGTPLHEFLIENPTYPALDSLRISRTTNQNGQLVMWTQMTKQSGQPAGTTQWLVHDWVDKPPGGGTVSSPVRHRWTYSDNERNEHLRVEDAAGNAVHCVFKRYEDYSFGVETARELFYEIAGGNPATSTTPANAETATSIKTTYTYYHTFSDANAGNWHKVATVESTDGAKAIFAYCNEFEQRGNIFEIRRPHRNTAPSLPGFGQAGEITAFTYDFTDHFGTRRLPTDIQTEVNGTVTAKSEFSYAYELITDASASYNQGNNVMPLTVITRKDYSDASNFVTTVTRVYREDADPQYKFFPGLSYSVQRPDKTMSVAVYYRSDYPPGSPFTANINGGARIHVTLHGTSDGTMGTSMTAYGQPYTQPLPANFRVVSGKSTESRALLGINALPLVSEERAYTGSWITTRQDWTAYVSLLWPSILQRRTADSGSFWNVVNNTWTAGRIATTVDETGTTQTLDYDSVGRVQSATRAAATYGNATISAQTFTMAYDAAGRLLSRTTTAGGESLATSASYDTAGRITSESASGRGTTSYSYNVSGRTVTATLPTGATRIETRYMDGRIASVTGTAQVAEHYDYSIEADGRRKSTFSLSTVGNARTVSTWVDRLGRLTQRSRPGFNNLTTFTETPGYNSTTGHLTTLGRTGYADLRFEHNGMGELTRRGLSLSGGVLEPSSPSDRITDLDTVVELHNGAYWLTSSTWVYHQPDSPDRTLVETARQRLTGLSPTLRAETRTTDVDGNETVRTVTVNAASKLVTVTTTRPGATNSATEVRLAGFLISTTGHDGVTFTRAYDALGRLASTTDPRSGTSTLQYHGNSPLVAWVRDAAMNYVATYTYDSAGRVTAVADAAGKLTRTAYNTRDQIIRRWGPAATPVEFAYNALGERIAMRTFRTGDFTGSAWPLADSGLDPTTGTPNPASWTSGDKTTWTHDGHSGLLASKTDADNKTVSYTYNNRGQTATRVWARNVTTTYGYDSNTGELLTQTYSDGTPSVTYAYNRTGRIASVQDYTTQSPFTGTRSFGYGTASGSHALRLDSVSLSSFYNNRVLTRSYDGVKRPNGFNIGSEVTQTHTYHSTTGRFDTLATASNVQSSRSFSYSYNTGGLVSGYSVVSGAFAVSRGYETNRDLLTSIDSTWNSVSRTRYDYTYNGLGQRVTAKQSGNVFTAADDFGGSTYYRYVYNDRGEVTEAVNYFGEDASSVSSPQLTGRRFGFAYDNIGNRTSGTRALGTSVNDVFTANSLNQYISRENDVTYTAGTARTDSAIAVTGGTTTANVGRAGRYWGAEVTLNNTNGPVLSTLAITATLSNPTLVRTEQRTAFLAKALQSFTYDFDGNLTGDGVWNYSYDGENRLTAMETDPSAIPFLGSTHARRLEFQYDYLNRRVQKLVRAGWNGSSYTTVLSQRRYLYDGWDLVAELSGEGISVLRSYTWGLDLAGSLTATGGVGALVQITDHGTSTSYLPTYDGNGNIASLLRASDGVVVAKYEYSPFGELLRVEGSYAKDNPFRFSTKFTDDESGLVYYGARFYSPSLGRFLNRDPIEEQGGLNLYGFAGNDGINNYDYLGYSWFSKVWNKIRHTVVSNVIRWVGNIVGAYYGYPGLGSALAGIYDTAVGAKYGGVKGAVAAALTNQIRVPVGQNGSIYINPGTIGLGRSHGGGGAASIIAQQGGFGSRSPYVWNWRDDDLPKDWRVTMVENSMTAWGIGGAIIGGIVGGGGGAVIGLPTGPGAVATGGAGAVVGAAGGAVIGAAAGKVVGHATVWVIDRADAALQSIIMHAEGTAGAGREINPSEVPVYRGGRDLTAKPSDVKIDPKTGQVKPTHGPSLDLNAANVEKFGGAHRIKSVPSELKIIQRGGRPEHFEIVPRQPMSQQRFQELLNQIEFL